ncbi:DUF305 domain-containing protein [Nesterenkonia lacusekhoensis]|uniref:Uncharacterized protein (DUF305 family) n=1 Tax=Nesterenkonia lacusekhoensis TaxID=150832 RepID=A0ABS4T0F9_9MICC|nr:DUF305 domain-containing protein [Nesterenkonia lacusekhoensis]MBP2317943.1 uncharacterized protein (DUF305 family) [Nesterenkonia lacusekhoensis]
MSEEDIAELETAEGDQAAQLFLEQMIVHHEGAVTVAEDHLANGGEPRGPGTIRRDHQRPAG